MNATDWRELAEDYAAMCEHLAAELQRHGHGGDFGYTDDCSSCDAMRRYDERGTA